MNYKKPTRILIAMDSFKGSASSLEVATFVKEGILRLEPDAVVTVVPVADGGEGTVEALVTGLGGGFEWAFVPGPLGEPVKARFGILPGNKAVIEMAAASGLTLIEAFDRNPLKTSSFGTGQLIQAALDRGCKHIFIGLGGSATNDGGFGMAQALGISFRDQSGQEIGPGAAGLAELDTIDFDGLDPRVQKSEIIGLTDVVNPLCGQSGASRIFGPQKGAQLADLEEMDRALQGLAALVSQTIDGDFSNTPGSGAAGGLGFGLLAFCGAKIQPGIETILDLIQFDEFLKTVDCVITGEGRLDEQSLSGKTPIGVAARAKKFSLPVIAIVGSCKIELEAATSAGIDRVLELINESVSLEESLLNTSSLARHAGENAMHAYLSMLHN